MKKFLRIALLGFSCCLVGQTLPEGFVYLHNTAPSIQKELRYLSKNNFIGKPIEGYQKSNIIVSSEAAKALKKIQQIQQAVAHFVRWALVLNDTLMKQQYYPEISKAALFEQGYIASKSSHSRGSTIDLTLMSTATKKEIDMGSSYDYFGIQSHPFYKNISKKQKENRMLLRNTMLANGFKPFENEWWHFTLKKEPFKDTYFNFPVH